MPYYPAPAIANAFLERHGGLGRLTQMQLQKLSYFAHGWNLAVNGTPLVDEEFQAWDYGPVSPKLYDHTKYFGSSPIDRPITEGDDDKMMFFLLNKQLAAPVYRAQFLASESAVIDRVYARYGTLSAFQMSQLTHQPGTPWHRSYVRGENRAIPNELIAEHYRGLGSVGGHA